MAGHTELIVNESPVSTGKVHFGRLYVWNSRNQSITLGDIGESIQWATAPSSLKVSYFGVRKDQVKGEIEDGLRFDLLHPMAGITIDFLTTSEPSVHLSGAVNGSQRNSGLIHRQKLNPIEKAKLYGFFWATSFLVILILLWRSDPPSSLKGWSAILFGSMVIGLMPAFLASPMVVVWYEFNLPPF